MKKFLPLLMVLVSFAVVACNDLGMSPTSPTSSIPNSTSDPSDPVVKDVLSKWSPYLGVHTPGGVNDAYRDALLAMKRNGTLKGVRVGIEKNDWGLHNTVIEMIASLGIEELTLIDNRYILDPNIEQELDQIFATYPYIKYFQIGNEVTSIGPVSDHITIEQYMPAFIRIYNHVQKNYPQIMLVTQCSSGSGTVAGEEVEKMYNLGLKNMSPNRVILSVNMYSSVTASTLPGIINKMPFRVWVTETGTTDPKTHMQHVQYTYPQLRDYLRAERIYWYVFWAGDPEPNSNLTDADLMIQSDYGYGLIRKPQSYPNYWKSPLFKILTGQQ